MRNLRKSAAVVLGACALLAIAQPAAAAPQGACRAGGYNQAILAPAMEKYWRWNLGGGSQSAVSLYFVPLPAGELISDDPYISQGSESFSVRVGRTLVLPLTFFIGESYVDGSRDDPADYPLNFRGSRVLLTVDGRVVTDSERSRIDCLYVPPTSFSQPIPYQEPTDYGSTAAEWMHGLGILLSPLPPGEHVIELQVVSPLREVFGVDIGYYNTWHVTVTGP
jgi:hypothetical protein